MNDGALTPPAPLPRAEPTAGRRLLRGWLSFALKLAVLCALGVALFTQVIYVGRVGGNEMFPAVKDGDLLVGFRLAGSLERDDVVVYRQDSAVRVGRVVAAAGDRVSITEGGEVLVNGAVQTGEILYPTEPGEALEYPYTVPEGCVFLLGDQRTDSEDSRTFGAVACAEVEAKVVTLMRRRGI